MRSFIGDLEALIPTDIDDSFTIEASRDHGAAGDGPFPLVLFSHGAASFRLQSSALARHLASWGMVVASPDHPTRELRAALGAPSADPPASPDDLRAARALLADASGDPVLDGVADTDLVGLGGHSAGGGTILAVAGDEGVGGYVSYASEAGENDLPDLPSLFMAGALDEIAEPEGTRAAFDRAPSPSWYWEIGASGHLAFSDLCAVGGGNATLIDLATAAGIGDFVPDGLRRLATDGCEDPNRPVQEVWPAVHQASTGFYRWIFGMDDEPLGLDGTPVENVTVETH